MFHVSPTPNIDVLLPFSSAEDIIDGEIVWDDDSKNIFKKCVSFGKTVIGCLMDVPMNSGYIYISQMKI